MEVPAQASNRRTKVSFLHLVYIYICSATPQIFWDPNLPERYESQNWRAEFPEAGIIRGFEKNCVEKQSYIAAVYCSLSGTKYSLLYVLSTRRKPSYDGSKLGRAFPYKTLEIITAIYILVKINF